MVEWLLERVERRSASRGVAERVVLELLELCQAVAVSLGGFGQKEQSRALSVVHSRYVGQQVTEASSWDAAMVAVRRQRVEPRA
jgi:hypothetical protein